MWVGAVAGIQSLEQFQLRAPSSLRHMPPV
jgi:hypothetical protein